MTRLPIIILLTLTFSGIVACKRPGIISPSIVYLDKADAERSWKLEEERVKLMDEEIKIHQNGMDRINGVLAGYKERGLASAEGMDIFNGVVEKMGETYKDLSAHLERGSRF